MNNIRKEIFINAAPESVWRHLEDQDLLAGWLMRNDFRGEPGTAFSFWQKASGNWDGTIHSQLVEFDPPRRMVFTWNANSIGVDTLVTIELENQAGGTLVRLLHTNWEGVIGDHRRHYQSHSEGWDDHLQVLARQAESEVHAIPAPDIDWTRFHLYLRIDASPGHIFDAWATPGGLESFFVDMMQARDPQGRVCTDDEVVHPGCRYVWRWDSGALVRGEYLEVSHNESLAFTFGECKVRVRLHPQQDSTLLELCQYGMPDDEQNRMHLHANCRAAWVYFLTVLKALLEHGIDGRDRHRATGSSFSTYFDPEKSGLRLRA